MLLYDRVKGPRPAPAPPLPSPPVIEPPRPAPEPEPEIPEGCPKGCTVQLPGCDIKGNISIERRERIYHVRGQQNYDDTIIAPEYGERWFCTEEEAVENGWRRAKR